MFLDFQGDISVEKVREFLREDDSREARQLLSKIIEEKGVDDLLNTLADCSARPPEIRDQRRSRPGAAAALRRELTTRFIPLLCALAAAGCDQGEPALDARRGPDLRVVATYPAAGQGIECAAGGAPDCGVPINAIIKLRFDRFLRPSTATRQSIRVYSGDRDTSLCQTTGGAETGCFFQPSYDMIERVVLYRLGENVTFVPGLLYNVEVVGPGEGGTDGLRAFDGAPLSEQGSVPLGFQFRTSSSVTDSEPPPARATCADVMPIFKVQCAKAGCHAKDTTDDPCPAGQAKPIFENSCVGVPRMGMELSSEEALLRTVRGQVAHETEVGGTAGTALENPSRMGVSMPRIDPGQPGNSYLMYKLLRDPGNFEGANGCRSDYDGLAEGDCVRPSAEETLRLRLWFVLGDPMPRRPAGAPGLETEQLRTIQSFIAGGANCP